MSWAVPPVTLVPCGHTLCGQCFTTMRRRAQELIPAPQRTRTEPIVRCPGCRRTVTNHTVSDALRRLVLECAPERVPHGAGADDTEATATLDSEFMDVWRSRLPEPGEPTMREIYDAHTSDDEGRDSEDTGEYFFAQTHQGLALDIPTYLALPDGELIRTTYTRDPVLGRVAVAQWVRRIEPGIVDLQRQRAEAAQRRGEDGDINRARAMIDQALAMIDRRIPRDLRQWTAAPDGTHWEYKYWRAPLIENVETAFFERMNEQGVECAREQGGYMLTLPTDQRSRFEHS